MSKVQLRRAARLFEAFTGDPGTHVQPVDYRTPKEGEALTYVGHVTAIAYEAVRDGESNEYEHQFSAKSRPVLAASADGKSLYLLAGAYKFTHRGIEDR